jgi:hypothetical protein
MFDRHLRTALKDFAFADAFVEIGWNHFDQNLPGVEVDGHLYTFEPVAEKKGAQVFAVSPDAKGLIPPRDVRRRIDRKAAGYARERLLIFTDRAKTKQVFLWVDRAPGKAPSYREHEWHTSQDPEGLVQKLSQLAFAIEEEDVLTVVDVAAKMEQAFDKEQVSKKFYREFDRRRRTFLGQIRGIPDDPLKEWYASALLNRLMFVYFLQRKGFLDGDRDYLRNRLALCRQRFGDDEFYSFYRTFLLKLFHDGLGAPESHREAELRELIGKVPYLNGGLFQIHDIERDYPAIQIPDEAFVELFGFFDTWDWTLDYRPLREGNEINPDVLGYLFEQYINQKQMGAYYTKEDITGYITRNALLPFVLDEARRRCPGGFKGEDAVWRLLREEPDAYIYPSVQHTARDDEGQPLPLPPEIAAGVDDVAKRGAWNTLTPPRWGLPTEIWRETVARRQRYEDLRTRLAAGEVTRTADLVSLNLDIEQFTKDAIDTCDDPDLLRAFWKALRSVTVLDPTCGSGAFLFAALERLEALYTACIHRMQEFVGRLDVDPPARSQQYSDFRDELKEAYDKGKHPNLTYFVLKRILLDNLYGVDIMTEAVEICKLRLFLKLAAQVEAGGRLEPLPDIDFNIRAGNALVGYASREEVKHGLTASRVAGGVNQAEFLFEDRADALAEFEKLLEDVAELAERFREQQQTYGGEVTAKDKEALRSRLRALAEQLNRALALTYDVDSTDSKALAAWTKSHQPFHWFAEFYRVMSQGGFSVIIGNPPYVRLSNVKGYSIRGCAEYGSDLYACVSVRALSLLTEAGCMGFIVMHSLAFSRDFEGLRHTLRQAARNAWISFFARIPSGLFAGDVRVRNAIFLLGPRRKDPEHYTTRIHRWNAVERDTLMQQIHHTVFRWKNVVPMFNSRAEWAFARKGRTLGVHFARHATHPLYFKQNAYNWIVLTPEAPPCFDERGKAIPQSEQGVLRFDSEAHRRYAALLGSGRLFFANWLVYGDEFHVTKGMFESFPIDFGRLEDVERKRLDEIYCTFEQRLENTVQFKLNAGKKVGSFNTSALWPLLDESDKIFARLLSDDPETLLDAVMHHVTTTIKTRDA